MSLTKKKELLAVAKDVCRDLRRRSTKAESLLWDELRGRRFMGKKFRRQHPVFHDLLGKESFYVPDFYCHNVKLAVELDGDIHKARRKHDETRSDVLKALGITVVRYRNEQVENNMPEVLETLRVTIERLSNATRSDARPRS